MSTLWRAFVSFNCWFISRMYDYSSSRIMDNVLHLRQIETSKCAREIRISEKYLDIFSATIRLIFNFQALYFSKYNPKLRQRGKFLIWAK